MFIKFKRPLFFIVLITLGLTCMSALCDEYKVDVGDILLITVYEQPDLASKVRVGSDGNINFPLIGNIEIKGLKVSEVEKKIQELLQKDYLVNPQVNVFIEQYRTEKVFVMGFVNRPGEYELFKDRPTTVLEAITMAGGFKESAAQNGTKILRVENGEEITVHVKITDITKKGSRDKDIAVKPGDIIVVPESFF